MTSVYAHIWNMKVEMDLSETSGGDVTLGIEHAKEELGKHHVDVSICMTQDQLQQLVNVIGEYYARLQATAKVEAPSNERDIEESAAHKSDGEGIA